VAQPKPQIYMPDIPQVLQLNTEGLPTCCYNIWKLHSKIYDTKRFTFKILPILYRNYRFETVITLSFLFHLLFPPEKNIGNLGMDIQKQCFCCTADIPDNNGNNIYHQKFRTQRETDCVKYLEGLHQVLHLNCLTLFNQLQSFSCRSNLSILLRQLPL